LLNVAAYSATLSMGCLSRPAHIHCVNTRTSDSADELDIVNLAQQLARSLNDRLDQRKYVKLESFISYDKESFKRVFDVRIKFPSSRDMEGIAFRVLIGVTASLSVARDVKKELTTQAKAVYNAAENVVLGLFRFKAGRQALSRDG
jgi:hypothetical protein